LSDAEGEGEPAVQPSAPFTDQRDVTTPVMTPPKSVTSPLRTLSPSSLEEPPAIDAAAGPPPTLPDTQLPPAVSKQPSVKMVDAATECGLYVFHILYCCCSGFSEIVLLVSRILSR